MRAHTKGYTRAHTMYYTGAHQVQHEDAHQDLRRALKDGGSSPYTCRSSEDVSTEHSIEAHTADKPDDIEHPTSTTAALVAAAQHRGEHAHQPERETLYGGAIKGKRPGRLQHQVLRRAAEDRTR